MTEPGALGFPSTAASRVRGVLRSAADHALVRRRTLLARRVGLAAAVLSALMAGVRAASDGVGDPSWAVNMAAVVGFAVAVGLTHVDRWRPATWVLVGTGLGSLIGAAWVRGGLASESLVYIAFPAWVSAYMLSVRAASVVAVGSALGVGLLYAGDVAGWTGSAGDPEIALTVRLGAALGAIALGFVFSWAEEARWRDANEEVVRTSARARAMLDALPDALLLMGADGNIRDARVPEGSPLAPAGHLAGRPLSAVVGVDNARTLDEAAARAAAAGDAIAVEVTVDVAAGPVDLEVRVSPYPEGGTIAWIRDISDRRRAERLRDQFVAMVSHELRTPLTSIHGTLGLLRSDAYALPESAAGLVELAYRNSDRLRRLIDDLLDIQKMDAGGLRLRIAEHPLPTLLAAAVRANEGFAAPHRVHIELGDVPDVVVRVDEVRFEQVVTNLISNAVKYSPEGETVTVEAAVSGPRVRIAVRDRGPGIPEAFRPHVFETFAQADSTQTRDVGGTGLGLAISKRLVESFGGRIGFETEVGVGTTFWFELPCVSG